MKLNAMKRDSSFETHSTTHTARQRGGVPASVGTPPPRWRWRCAGTGPWWRAYGLGQVHAARTLSGYGVCDVQSRDTRPHQPSDARVVPCAAHTTLARRATRRRRAPVFRALPFWASAFGLFSARRLRIARSVGSVLGIRVGIKTIGVGDLRVPRQHSSPIIRRDDRSATVRTVHVGTRGSRYSRGPSIPHPAHAEHLARQRVRMPTASPPLSGL